MNKRKIVFLCGARDFHAMDWYRSAKNKLTSFDSVLFTDLISGEGFKKIILPNDTIYKLLIIDKILFRKQNRTGDIWRNLIKLFVLPIQVLKLRRFNKKNPDAVYHAHGMYYLFLAKIAGVNYIGTPQGSEILIRPDQSKLYRFIATIALMGANAITVDSVNMREKIQKICDVDAKIIQNGIDVESIMKLKTKSSINSVQRNKFLSIRGLTPLYRIHNIIGARNNSEENKNVKLTFIYPFKDEEYRDKSIQFRCDDIDLGRLDRNKMYQILYNSYIVFSIPKSDSSPRSVYEAIFCGSVVAITHNSYYDILPECMKERIVLVNLNNPNWFDLAINDAKKVYEKNFELSDEAVSIFDQNKSFEIISKLYYNFN